MKMFELRVKSKVDGVWEPVIGDNAKSRSAFMRDHAKEIEVIRKSKVQWRVREEGYVEREAASPSELV